MDEEIINDLNDELEGAIEEGQSMLRNEELQERLEELKTETELLIRKHPIKSVLAGAVTGYLLARLLK
ncbi:hypothetical protein [Rhodohalobacter mucosus]|uniref:DUF883 domain-containing protein n=1 Tax=Rhodohalobacter mucosus TaxID=2079485 RepID=A0A316TQJ0_9BACT|nr:hypothetical protein [Rhodohalobacter mucosus]PWN06670.1 hypothetical protein DDZ15_09145 [Rhodohalobacter mucosus]